MQYEEACNKRLLKYYPSYVHRPKTTLRTDLISRKSACSSLTPNLHLLALPAGLRLIFLCINHGFSSFKLVIFNINNILNHRIIEWFGLEGTLKIIWFQIPCHEQGHLPPDQVAQSSIQPGLEHCQGGGSHSFSGQSLPVPHHPHGEEFLPNIQSKYALF